MFGSFPKAWTAWTEDELNSLGRKLKSNADRIYVKRKREERGQIGCEHTIRAEEKITVYLKTLQKRYYWRKEGLACVECKIVMIEHCTSN